jgi:mRNA-degrading endonuclease RelE of RelBE toxin-antitoxin system
MRFGYWAQILVRLAAANWSSGRWRIRVGDYRVIYGIDDTAHAVLVLHVGHRRDIYS